MDEVMSGYTGELCQVYLDDILINITEEEKILKLGDLVLLRNYILSNEADG